MEGTLCACPQFAASLHRRDLTVNTINDPLGAASGRGVNFPGLLDLTDDCGQLRTVTDVGKAG